MLLLDAPTSACALFCAAVSETLGPQIAELVLFGAGILAVYWNSRRRIAAVQKIANVAHERASVAETEATSAKVEAANAKAEVAAIVSSLRPPPRGTNVSGQYDPVLVQSPLPPPPAAPPPVVVQPSISPQQDRESDPP
jgi:hypothetical protein